MPDKKKVKNIKKVKSKPTIKKVSFRTKDGKKVTFKAKVPKKIVKTTNTKKKSDAYKKIIEGLNTLRKLK